MAYHTTKIRIAGTEFRGETKAIRLLYSYFRNVDRHLKGNEDAVAIAEDIAIAVRDRLLDHVSDISGKITLVIAQEVTQLTGLPFADTPAMQNQNITLKTRAIIGLAGSLFIIFGLFLATFQGPVRIWWTSRIQWHVNIGPEYWFAQISDNFVRYFAAGFWPIFSFLTYTLFGLVCIATGVWSLHYVFKNRYNKKYYQVLWITQVTLFALVIIWFSSIQLLRSSTWERISASNRANIGHFSQCGRKIDVALPIEAGQADALFYNSIADGWQFVIPVSNNIDKPDHGQGPDPLLDCEKINQYIASHSDKKIVIMLYRSGTNGQILSATEQNIPTTGQYYGLFIKN